MKNLIVCLLSAVLICLNSSCYTNDCAGEVGLYIKLINYPAGNYDVAIERFTKNTNLNALVSSDMSSIEWTNRDVAASLILNFRPDMNNEDYDYRITMLSDSNTFTITNLEVDKDATDRKFGLIHTKEQLVCPYKNLNVNGQQVGVDGNKILLTK